MSNVIPFTLARRFDVVQPAPPPLDRAALEAMLNDTLDIASRLIALLDGLDGDPDLEPDDDREPEDEGDDADLEPDADDEPSLGAPEGHECQVGWARGNDQDREMDHRRPQG